MNVITTPFEGLLILEPRIFGDERGYFFESFNEQVFEKETGFKYKFVQDNQARSVKNVLRGLHYQNEPIAQSKLLRCLQGSIWDVVVDLRKDSATYKQWYGIELSDENKRQFLVPRGFAHGYSVLSDSAEVFYKCDNFYSKENEGGVFYNDPSLGIDWKINLADAIVSDKDKIQSLLMDCNSRF
ncbi:MAG: dTDP-4-dehydrorhamnose 3,5-epimerase [Phycisphaerales bacterium]|nr:dTDP-4-dehydrorhamnose 3,5-epimerase [Phycisphaerales bacterium]